jgi:hypothetical protein
VHGGEREREKQQKNLDKSISGVSKRWKLQRQIIVSFLLFFAVKELAGLS